MRAASLPSLRGRVSTAHQLRIACAYAISGAQVVAKRNGLGYSQAATDLQAFFEACKDALSTTTRADSISVDPATDTIAALETQQLVVTATYADGVTEDVAADPRCTYESSDPTKATVSATGLITGVATGSTTVTATYHGRTDTCVVTVS